MSRGCRRGIPPGTKFGRWTVVEKLTTPKGAKNRNVRYLCRCDCGNTKSIFGASLSGVKSTSCGCWLKEVNSKRLRLPDNQGIINLLYHRLNCSARKRGIEVSLTKEEMAAIIGKPCAYCGDEPNQNGDKLRQYDNGDPTFMFHGVDRVDSSQGYHKDNVVTCCTTCNFMKRDYTCETFKAQVEKIHRHTLASL